MSSTLSLPQYAHIEDALQQLQSTVSAADVHGVLCALFCGNAQVSLQAWLSSLPSTENQITEHDLNDTLEPLKVLFETTSIWFNSEDSYSLQLLLPDDNHNIRDRIEALAFWCQGFITGLNLLGIDLKNQSDEIIQEGFSDLLNMSCLHYDDEQTGDQEIESAFVDLVEYARLAVMATYQQREDLTRVQSTRH